MIDWKRYNNTNSNTRPNYIDDSRWGYEAHNEAMNAERGVELLIKENETLKNSISLLETEISAIKRMIATMGRSDLNE